VDRVPEVSVIIPVFNGMPHIERTIQSLLDQTIGFERLQVLIIDDGSTDETPAFIDRAAVGRPSIEVYHQPASGNPAGPRNFAIERARGRYIFFLDADDHLSPDALLAMVDVADANGTDVVLARVLGVGGRGSPRSPCARTLPRTDVFHCNAYWSLNPMKMFRTELVRSLGLRFSMDMPWGEDQPFTAMAYLKGNGISILADKDYVFWVFLADRSNITTRVASLADRMPVVNTMFDLVAAEVPEGADRDRLLLRHFQVELVVSAFEAYRRESDTQARSAAFERFGAIVRAYYSDAIEQALHPRSRVLMRFVTQGDEAGFAAYLDTLAPGVQSETLVEGGSVFQQLPGFRDPATPLPDSLFDVGPGLRASCRVEPLKAGRAGLGIEASCRLGALSHAVTGVALLACSENAAGEISVPLNHRIVTEETQPYVLVRDTVEAGRLLAVLPTGTYKLFIRVSAGEVSRQVGVFECALPPARPRVVRSWALPMRSGTLATTSKGHLTIKVVVGTRTALRGAARRAYGRLRRLAGRGETVR
jgi:CDP-glycerol glycerophosphotransferase